MRGTCGGLAATLLLALALGCAPTLRRVDGGITAYERGEYPLAMQRFVEAEGEEGGLPDGLRLKVLVYRGLAAWHLGQKPEAKALLTKGKRAYDEGDPRRLPPAIVAEMNQALAQLGGP